jgi:hypothetical protein
MYILVYLFAFCIAPNLVALLLFRAVCSSNGFWTLFGHRRRLWQIFLPIAYALGVVGMLALAIMDWYGI